MNIEQYLNHLKKDYLETEPPEKLNQEGWQTLRSKIGQMEIKKSSRAIFYLRPFAFAILTIFILAGGLTGLVQASKNTIPGEPLYPVKRFSENLVSTTTGNNLIKVDNRAQEIVKLSEKKTEDTVALGKAVSEYKKAITEASRSGKRTEQFQEKLEKHEEEFKEIKERSSEKKEIEKAIEISREGRHSQEGENEEREEKEDQTDQREDREEDRSGSNSGSD